MKIKLNLKQVHYLGNVRVLFFEGCVVEKLLDEVDVAEQHPAAAVPLQAERVQCVTENKNKQVLKLVLKLV